MGFRIPELDTSARAGMLVAGFTAGRSGEPNLLTRATRDQALITGVTAAVGYGVGVSGHSFLDSISRRLPMTPVASGLIVDAVATTVGVAGMNLLPPAAKQSKGQAIAHLAARATYGVGAAGMIATGLEALRGRRGGRTAAYVTLAAVGLASWAKTRPGRAQFGSLQEDGSYLEDTPRTMSAVESVAFGVASAGALVALSHAESVGASAVSEAAAKTFGGEPEDHRTFGRIGISLITGAAGWGALTLVSSKLATAGQSLDAATEERPTLPEITGSPASGISWDIQSREGTRWLADTLEADHIEAVMGEPSKQPIRVYASLSAADTEEARAELLLSELDRTKAFERGHVALFSPTGSGYVNYVATETYEFLTKGDCASAAIEYSVLPSALSLTRAEGGTRQTRLVLDGIAERLRNLPPEDRPRVYLFGESLGCRVAQEAFTGATDQSLRAVGLDAAVFVGTPSFTQWRRVVWGGRPLNERPAVGPGAIFLPRSETDWRELPQEERDQVQYLLLQNGDDPVPKFDGRILWREPDWLGPEGTRPPGAPTGTKWQPVSSFLATFVDLLNALTPTPGRFEYGGHDYRAVIPDAVADVWRLGGTPEQRERIYKLMENRERMWEIKRILAEAAAKPEAKRDDAMKKAKAKVADLESQPEG